MNNRKVRRLESTLSQEQADVNIISLISRSGFHRIQEKVTNPNPNHLFFDFVNAFKRSETVKLIIAPTIAKIMVFTISSETILGTTLNKVPDAVPICRLLFDSISR